ncbi:MAG: 3-dehydroquinate synthase [Phycisphaerales bacterium]|nr:3-dehydroquinate synthase [Phycisphaerales bacterium]
MPPLPRAASPRIVTVTTPSRTYDVLIGAGVAMSSADRLRAALAGARKVHVFVDGSLRNATVVAFLAHVRNAGFEVRDSPVLVSEDAKVLQNLYHMLQPLAGRELDRADAVIALGGGIVGDMAGFAAASYRRGIRWINVPTTLLSMVDASVGGKTGVNLRVGLELQKNMLGAFWQPSLVLADPTLLESLDDRHYRSGLAECVKHALLSADWQDAELEQWMRANAALIVARDPDTLTELIARNVAIKARVVGTDEREESSGPSGRALLNLGHTFGHAIETLENVSPSPDRSLAPLHHGEAVALGLICAARTAELTRHVGDGFTDHLRGLLKTLHLPTAAHGLPAPAAIIERMHHDKKVLSGKLRLILPTGPGTCAVVPAPDDDVLHQAIEAIQA